MTKKEVAMVTEVSSGARPVKPEKNVGAGGVQTELEDLFSSLKRMQNTDASDILAALACLSIGSGSEEV